MQKLHPWEYPFIFPMWGIRKKKVNLFVYHHLSKLRNKKRRVSYNRERKFLSCNRFSLNFPLNFSFQPYFSSYFFCTCVLMLSTSIDLSKFPWKSASYVEEQTYRRWETGEKVKGYRQCSCEMKKRERKCVVAAHRSDVSYCGIGTQK